MCIHIYIYKKIYIRKVNKCIPYIYILDVFIDFSDGVLLYIRVVNLFTLDFYIHIYIAIPIHKRYVYKYI